MVDLLVRKTCSECGACENICPKSAIKMVEDAMGDRYPEIDELRCIDCNACVKVCMCRQETVLNKPLKVYAAQSINKINLRKSASGALFQTLAREVLKMGGVVVGAAWDLKNDESILNCCVIERQEDIDLLLGSKYVKCSSGLVFKRIKKLLLSNTFVLFSGTPCQVSGLINYLGKKYENLLTVDIICHGSPNQKILKEYIVSTEKVDIKDIVDISFRDKTRGWGSSFSYILKNGKKVRIPCNASSYIWSFYKGLLFRESCFNCRFATDKRVSDITIGDYWGIEVEHPETVTGADAPFDLSDGISCVLINSRKGLEYFDKIKDDVLWFESSIELVKKHNTQLNHPMSKHIKREGYLSAYILGGYKGIEEKYRKDVGIKYIYYVLNDYIPKDTKYRIKEFVRRIGGK